MQLVLTPDYPNDPQFTFLVYDLESKRCVLKKEKNNNLDSINLADQGRHTFRPFGLYHYEDRIFVASNDKIAIYDSCSFEYKENLNVPLFINTHQILVQDNILYTCNTSTDTIGIHELDHNKSYFLDIRSYVISDSITPPKNAYSSDIHHINSLFYSNNRLYFCLHNKNRDLSEFAYLNLKDKKIVKIIKSGSCCHNIEIIDNVLYSLSTKTGQLLICDLNNLQIKHIDLVDSSIMFLRGMRAFNGDLLIGVFNWRDQNNCFIIKYEIKTGKVSDYLKINDAYSISDFILI